MVQDNAFLIEGAFASPLDLPLVGRKYALLIQGRDPKLDPSLYVAVDALVDAGYDEVLVVKQGRTSDLATHGYSLRRTRIFGAISDLAKKLDPEDVIFTGLIGNAVSDDGRISFEDSNGEHVYADELVTALSAVPVYRGIHYVSMHNPSGDLAKMLSGVSHPDLSARHTAVAPVLPGVSYRLVPYTQPQQGFGPIPNPVTRDAFHAGFFSTGTYGSLRDRFVTAARLQQSVVPAARVYMHTKCDPATFSLTR